MRVYRWMIAVCLFAAGCGGGGSSSSPPGLPASGGSAPSPAAPSPTPSASATPSGGPSPAAGQISVDAAASGPAISRDVLGAAVATWSDITQPQIASSMGSIGLAMTRWPGGSESDAYHWQTNSVCAGNGYVYPASTFDNFMSEVARPNHLEVAVTVNYGSNAACNGGGDPTEAAAWVSYAKAHGQIVKWWTVGNEVYGGWEYDLHPAAHDPTTYANAVSTGYYPLMKAADPNAQIGIVVSDGYSTSWDATVLRNAKFDFVEDHYYAQGPGNETDAYLLGQGIIDFANALSNLRATMNAAGVPASVPIYVGELNSVYANPGKQTVSIVNGLFAGMAVAEMMKQGIPMATWWIAFGGCSTGTNNASTLYGWQSFGTYTLFSDGNGECGSNIPIGTPFPTARAYALLSSFAPAGSHLVSANLGTGVGNVRAYAASNPGGYALLLFNLDPTNAQTLSVALSNTGRTTFSGNQIAYGKAQYDDSKGGVWTGPVAASLGTLGTTFNLTLAPYSMSVVSLR